MAQVRRRGHHAGRTLVVLGVLVASGGRHAPCQMCQTGPAAIVPVVLAAGETLPAYEVATIKAWDGKGFAIPLQSYIQQAFGLSPNTIGRVIGPDWIASARYVIRANPPDALRHSMEAMTAAERARENGLMMQALLADRFKLQAHLETRELPVYELQLAKGGSKLNADPESTKGRIAVGGSSFRATATPIHNLAEVLECAADIGGREVIDKTGLAGLYDFSLKWTPLQTATVPGDGSAASPDEGATLFTAIEEQLGLRLVPTKGPSQVLVIDHIERPSEN